MLQTQPNVASADVVKAMLFEALHASMPRGGAAEARLRKLGFDPEQPRATYPVEVWIACVEAAAEELFPTRSRRDGARELGRLWLTGFAGTLVGKVMLAAVGLMGPDRLLSHVPRSFATGRTGVSAQVMALGPTERLLQIRDPKPLPDFVAGIFEALLQRSGTRATVEVDERRVDGFAIRVRW